MMKVRPTAVAAALLFATATTGPVFAADCDSSTDGKQPPGLYISSVAKANNGLGKWGPFKAAVKGEPDQVLATDINGTGDTVVTDDKKGAGKDIQALLGTACGVGSRRGDRVEAALP